MSRASESARPISGIEAAVIQRALEAAATDPSALELASQISQLRVIGGCGCGCASVEFRQPTQGQSAVIVADAEATTHSGEQIGLLVWAIEGQLSGLEVYSYSDAPAPLPDPESIGRYQGSGSTDAA